MSMTLSPLAGITIIELAAIGPVPFATHILRQLGAEVIVVNSPHDRQLGIPIRVEYHYLQQHKKLTTIDLKCPSGRGKLFSMLRKADVLVEGFRPGTLERLDLSPASLHTHKPDLLIGRCGGSGQASTRRQDAGHDINYLALSGVLHAIGKEQPMPPVNLIGDFGGAGMHLAVGLMAAIIQLSKDGQGRVIETSILEGSISLMTMIYGLADAQQWTVEREANILDGGAPFYQCYQTADNKWMAVGAIEKKFFQLFIEKIGANIDISRQHDKTYWPKIRKEIASSIRKKTRDQWDALFIHTDCCCTPVLDMHEAREPHGIPEYFQNGIPIPPFTFT